MNTALLASYARALLATALTAILTIDKSPLDFTGSDWKLAANSIIIAIIPVVLRWLNPKDPAFGRGKQ